MNFLIRDVGDSHNWSQHFGGGLLIPAGKAPSVLQANRFLAEREALRLAGLDREGCFVVFAPIAVARRQTVTTHVNLRGEPVCHDNVAQLLPIDDGVPF